MPLSAAAVVCVSPCTLQTPALSVFNYKDDGLVTSWTPCFSIIRGPCEVMCVCLEESGPHFYRRLLHVQATGPVGVKGGGR